MRFKQASRPHILHIELTAMIDVIFLLIIFFMTTAQFVQRSRAEVELPQESGQDERPTETPPFVINVLADGSNPYIVGDGRAMNLDILLDLVDREITRLAREENRSPDAMEITIRADRRGMSRAINELASELRDRGVTHWRLAVEETN